LDAPARSSDVRFNRLKRTLQQTFFAPAFAAKACYTFCSDSVGDVLPAGWFEALEEI